MRKLICLLALLLMCFEPEDRIVSTNHVTGGCSRSPLGKSTQLSDLNSSDDFKWYYDVQSRILTLHLTSIWSNCSDEIEIYATREGEIHVLHLDIIEGAMVDCRCSFYAKCDIPDVTDSLFVVEFSDNLYSLDLSEDSGAFDLSGI